MDFRRAAGDLHRRLAVEDPGRMVQRRLQRRHRLSQLRRPEGLPVRAVSRTARTEVASAGRPAQHGRPGSFSGAADAKEAAGMKTATTVAAALLLCAAAAAQDSAPAAHGAAGGLATRSVAQYTDLEQ